MSHKRWDNRLKLIAAIPLGLFMVAAIIVTVSFVGLTSSSVTTESGDSIRVKVANSAGERAQGLSGTQSLKANTGMLFVFEDSERWGIWMKDMNYPIDIVWIDERGKIVTIKSMVSPETYPSSFKPDEPAKYVLELPAASAKTQYGMRVGDTLELDY